MLTLWTKFQSLVRKEDGASMVEYALLLVLIAVVSILVITNVGTKTSTTFSKIDSAM